ncbi:MAG: hypothetical protein ACYTGZ_14080 [Planctomycetota bacterium]|jgi:hypothetical protein
MKELIFESLLCVAAVASPLIFFREGLRSLTHRPLVLLIGLGLCALAGYFVIPQLGALASKSSVGWWGVGAIWISVCLMCLAAAGWVEHVVEFLAEYAGCLGFLALGFVAFAGIGLLFSRFPVQTATVGSVLFLAPRAFLTLVAWRTRFASRRAYLRAYSLARTSREPFFFILRSFANFETYVTREIHETHDLARDKKTTTSVTQNNLLESIIESLAPHGMCVVLGSEDIHLRRLYRFRGKLLMLDCDNEVWSDNFADLAQSAAILVSVPGPTRGAMEELQYLTEHDLVSRTLFFAPSLGPGRSKRVVEKLGKRRDVKSVPLSMPKQRDVWEQTRSRCEAFGLKLPPFDSGAVIAMRSATEPEHVCTLERADWSAQDRRTLADLVKQRTGPGLSEILPRLQVPDPRESVAEGHIPGRSYSFSRWLRVYSWWSTASLLIGTTAILLAIYARAAPDESEVILAAAICAFCTWLPYAKEPL